MNRWHVFALTCIALTASESPAQWPRHTIDNTSRGADGVRLADINGDGFQDVVTGWEEGGVVRVYVHPGPAHVREPWPRQTVGKAPSPEDAFAVDLDDDGRLEVVSCHEGQKRSVIFHTQSNSGDWISQPIDSTVGASQWMYGFGMQIDGQHGLDLVVGSKGSRDGTIAWLESPRDPRQTAAWKRHDIGPAHWIMSLEPVDMDQDGDTDIVVTDRKGQHRGLYWLERLNLPAVRWKRHDIGLHDHEVMFVQLLASGSGPPMIWLATRNATLHCFQRIGDQWTQSTFDNPFGVRCGKAIAVARPTKAGPHDKNQLVIAHTSNTAASQVPHQRPGVAMTRATRTKDGWKLAPWVDVSGLEGTKFDRIEWIDLDSDGDLDLLTCEETDNLGVFWYEQP